MKLFIKREDVIVKEVSDENGNEHEIRLRHSMSPVVRSAANELYITQQENKEKAAEADKNKDVRSQVEVVKAIDDANMAMYASFIESWTFEDELTNDIALNVVINNKELRDFIDENCYKKEQEYNAKKNN